jgi:hypothetical protein
MIVRFSLFALALAVSATTSAAPTPDRTSDLDRLSNTENFRGRPDSDAAPTSPTGGRICNGVETGNNAPCPPPDAPPVPVDGGLSLLALAGAGYAAKRLRARRA